MNAICFDNVVIEAGGRRIIDSLSMNIACGEFVTILGPNGAGKTTFLKAAMGITRAASGKIFLSGNAAGTAGFEAARVKTGYMPQRVDVDRFFPVQVKDVACLAGKKYAAKAKELCAAFGVSALWNEPFGVVSGGERQKVMLAMVLSREPETLLLDEPNLNLDMLSYANFLKLVSEVYESRRITTVFVTHLIHHIPEKSSRVIVIKEGKAVFSGSRQELFEKEAHMEFIYA